MRSRCAASTYKLLVRHDHVWSVCQDVFDGVVMWLEALYELEC